nr:NEDD8-activating enzyme E1 regulatory subunit-like [Ciona intestinalis]|eukprot:XP_002124435.1 NEDD8-activating enzyme E1 regulatory subunit-like [Ciona intestinalis]
MGEKEKKYDRQLRLWGDHGQQVLERARICLINVTATSTEILKNLILPGVGSFLILDGGRISGEDAGNNFFLDPSAIGQLKAKVATELLLELNPDVKGDYTEEDLNQLLDRNPQFFQCFTVIIASSLDVVTHKKLAALLWKHNIPLVTCYSYGFIGYMRIIVREHCVVESHPDNAHEDLRLLDPFPELVEYIDSIDLEKMDKKQHSHVPYLVILYKFLQAWKNEHGGQAPKNWKEKKLFKEKVLQGVRINEHGMQEDEENFEEASKQVNTALVESKIPENLQQIFNDAKCCNISENSTNFWILANGLKQFVQNNDKSSLPLRGSLPDMFSDSESYVKLQNIYKTKAKQDIDLLTSYIRDFGAVNGRLSDQEIKRFCRNASFLQVVRSRSLSEEYENASQSILDGLISEGDSDAIWYVMLRCVEQFYTNFSRYPGVKADDIDIDVTRLKNCVQELTRSWGVPGLVEAMSDDYVQEICRVGAAEIHSVASYMGGVAAQEVIKLITAQYVPIVGVYIYNGLKSTSVSLNV